VIAPAAAGRGRALPDECLVSRADCYTRKRYS
jgi:hypothetical protein